MDTPATSRKRPASSPLNAQDHQPTVSVASISPPRASRHSQISVVEWQCKNEVSIHRTARYFSIEGGGGGGRNRERKCRIPRISPPALCTKAYVAKGGTYLRDTTVIVPHKPRLHVSCNLDMRQEPGSITVAVRRGAGAKKDSMRFCAIPLWINTGSFISHLVSDTH